VDFKATSPIGGCGLVRRLPVPLIMFRSPMAAAGGSLARSRVDSPSLRRLAELQFPEAGAAIALMPEALRSIGFDPAAADEEFTARCQAALVIVQGDLDVTGYGQYRMRAHLDSGWPPAVFAALPDGSYWSGAWGMTRQMDDASPALHCGFIGLWHARRDASDPVAGLRRPPRYSPGLSLVWRGARRDHRWRGVVVVSARGHALAPVGQLTGRRQGRE